MEQSQLSTNEGFHGMLKTPIWAKWGYVSGPLLYLPFWPYKLPQALQLSPTPYLPCSPQLFGLP